MIIDRIVVENLGVYNGRHEAILSPPDPRRPITLFGGNNGAGKTTLLKAIFLAFYGKRAPLADRNGQIYEEYLAECINDEANPHIGARVEIHFRKLEGGKERPYRVCRRWWLSSKGLEERLDVYEDELTLNDVLSQGWDEFIEDYLPARIANLFFFDGEQIKNLADPESSSQLLRTAVQSLLGLEIVDRLSNDLVVLERRKRQAGKNDADRQRLEAIQQEIHRLEELHEAAKLDAGEAKVAVDRARKDLSEAEERYVVEGGSLMEQRGALKEDQVRLNREIEEAENELRVMAAGELPFVMGADLLSDIENAMSKEVDASQSELELAALETRDHALLSYLKRNKAAPDILKVIRTWQDNDLAQRKGSKPADKIFVATDSELEGLRALLQRLPGLREQAAMLVEKIRRLERDLDKTDQRLAQVPDDDKIRTFHNRVAECREILKKAESTHAIFLEKCDLLLKESAAKKIAYGREIEKHAELDDAIDSDRRILQHSALVRKTLDRFKVESIARRIGQLESLICESFTRLIRKPNFVSSIKIDPNTFNINLLDPKGRVMPMNRLSAGESQLLATAMLWGLARASGRVVPTLIDTPLGRLDSSHRKHLVERYFPHAAHQVILLSTDEEITQCHLDRLRPHVGNTYRLEYDVEKRSTAIVQGYLFP